MSGVRVLVVDDEPDVCSYLVPLLAREGFAATAVATGTDALAAVADPDQRPDLVLLDIGLPDMSGFEVCRAIRRLSDYLPVIMVTGWNGPNHELHGFAAKADDYVTKPIVPEALIARIRAVLRLVRVGSPRTVQLGSVEVDLAVQQVRRDGVQVPLGRLEFALLAFLVEHPGQIFGKTQLLTRIWGPEAEVDPHNVEAKMSRVRAAVEDNPNAPRFVHNRRGLGYYVTLEPRG
ncbi:MAG TPA: response regulator transcription factor [Mycobacteriales bacterium]|nr:response regulator transcription factor [Mycobacteriales bacterium]